MGLIRIFLGDCIARMRVLSGDLVQVILTDPPYDLTSAGKAKTDRPTKGFMGKAWDGTGIAFSPDLWAEALRVLEPGGQAKVFGGTRTFHRVAAAMEAAGFIEVHLESWAYGSGFPKSLNIGKALDKMAGAMRETKRLPYTGDAVLRSGGQNTRPWMEEALKKGYHELAGDEPVTDAAKAWDGWGTALKPAWEPILVGTKPGQAA